MNPDFHYDSVELHIEELILRGFPPGSKAEIIQHIERELTSLLQQGGLPAELTRDGSLPRLAGGSFDVAPQATAQELGAQVAQTLYQGLGQ